MSCLGGRILSEKTSRRVDIEIEPWFSNLLDDNAVCGKCLRTEDNVNTERFAGGARNQRSYRAAI